MGPENNRVQGFRAENPAPLNRGRVHFRSVRPLGLYFWGGVWTLASWCEMRKDFRNFRVDRMAELRVVEQQFPADPKKSLQAFIAKMREESSPI
ncbi:MAG: WYL domain-containing protein [Terriglobales bacterium]